MTGVGFLVRAVVGEEGRGGEGEREGEGGGSVGGVGGEGGGGESGGGGGGEGGVGGEGGGRESGEGGGDEGGVGALVIATESLAIGEQEKDKTVAMETPNQEPGLERSESVAQTDLKTSHELSCDLQTQPLTSPSDEEIRQWWSEHYNSYYWYSFSVFRGERLGWKEGLGWEEGAAGGEGLGWKEGAAGGEGLGWEEGAAGGEGLGWEEGAAGGEGLGWKEGAAGGERPGWEEGAAGGESIVITSHEVSSLVVMCVQVCLLWGRGGGRCVRGEDNMSFSLHCVCSC